MGSLEKLFGPESIAVIGASNRPGSVGYSLMDNLVGSGYRGVVYPVNPKRKSVFGIPAYKSVLDVPERVDLAVIATPSFTVPKIVKQCVEANVGSLIVVSSGFGEIGREGERLEKEILKILRGSGIRLLGPNCLGYIRTDKKVNASFAIRNALPGKLALISQSGALCSGILDWADKKKVGFKYFISIGAMLDVNCSDLIEFLERDGEIEALAVYLESIKDSKKFLKATKRFSRKRPLIVVKSGRYKESAEAAVTHTGSMAGNDEVFEAAFARAGIVRIEDIQDLLGASEALAKESLPKGNRLAILTNAGGPGVMATDATVKNKLRLARLSSKAMKALEREMPSHWSRSNPVDLLGDAGPGLYEKALKVLLREKGVDGIVVILSPQAISKPLDVAKAVVSTARDSKKPVLACWLGGSFVESGRKYLRENGLPGYRSPEVAVRAFAYMDSYRERMKFLREAEKESALDVEPDREKIREIFAEYLEKGRSVLTECNSKAVLAEYGIPVNETLFAGNPKEAAEKAKRVGFPVVLKVVSDDITHKTDAGGVALGIASEKEVKEKFGAIARKAKKTFPKAKVLGVSVQKMVPMGKAELILGKKLDPIFGPVMLFGAGGITTEVFQDKSIGLPPVNRKVAKRMIEKTKISKLFSGKRARIKLKKAELEKVLVRFSHFCVDFPQVKEVDINPLIVSGGKLYAVDARVVLKE